MASRPYRSDSRPTIGTAVVDATRYEVVTQVNRSNPPMVRDYPGHRRTNDRLVEGSQKEREHQAAHREDDLSSGNRLEVYFRRRSLDKALRRRERELTH